MNRCIFLDRDGILNVERGDYVYKVKDFEIVAGVPQALACLKAKGFLLIVITNQGGMAKNIYTKQQMDTCHRYLQEVCNGVIDTFYYAPYHPVITHSLSRKPGSLLFEKAIAKYHIAVHQSWMIGDRESDLLPAQKLGVKTIQVTDNAHLSIADYTVMNIRDAVQVIETTHKH